MMLFDHVASTIILSNSIHAVKKDKSLWIICILSAVLPDLLAFFYHPGSIEYLFHRRYTNSIFLAPLYVLVVASVFKLVFYKNKVPFYLYFIMSLINYYLHILLDLVTPFGSTIFFPLANRIYSLDIFHSFDPIFIAISAFVIIVSILYVYKKRKSFYRFIRYSIYAYLLYFSFIIIFKLIASANYEKYLSIHYPNSQYEAIVPKTFWRWRVIASSQDKIQQLNGILNVKNVKEYNSIENIPEFIRQEYYYRSFLLYARYPAVQFDENQISIINAIYSDQSYRLSFEVENDSVVSKKISGFDLIDK